MLLARHQSRHATRPLRWLDLMAGCGIRALRWGLEALANPAVETELWINDGDPDRLSLIQANAAGLGCSTRLTAEAADLYCTARLLSATGSISSTLMPLVLLGL